MSQDSIIAQRLRTQSGQLAHAGRRSRRVLEWPGGGAFPWNLFTFGFSWLAANQVRINAGTIPLGTSAVDFSQTDVELTCGPIAYVYAECTIHGQSQKIANMDTYPTRSGDALRYCLFSFNLVGVETYEFRLCHNLGDIPLHATIQTS